MCTKEENQGPAIFRPYHEELGIYLRFKQQRTKTEAQKDIRKYPRPDTTKYILVSTPLAYISSEQNGRITQRLHTLYSLPYNFSLSKDFALSGCTTTCQSTQNPQ